MRNVWGGVVSVVTLPERDGSVRQWVGGEEATGVAWVFGESREPPPLRRSRCRGFSLVQWGRSGGGDPTPTAVARRCSSAHHQHLLSLRCRSDKTPGQWTTPDRPPTGPEADTGSSSVRLGRFSRVSEGKAPLSPRPLVLTSLPPHSSIIPLNHSPVDMVT